MNNIEQGNLVRITPFWKTTAKKSRKVYLRSKNLGDGRVDEKSVYLQIRENTYKGSNNPLGSLFSNEPDVHLLINDNQIDGLIDYLQELKLQVVEKKKQDAELVVEENDE